MTATPPARRSFLARLVPVACLGLAVLVVVLSLQNRELKQALASERAKHARQDAARLRPGERLSPFRVRDDTGAVRTVAFEGDGRATLLLFHAEGCTVCPQAFLSWEEAVPLFQDAGTRAIAIQLDAPPGEPLVPGPPGVERVTLANVSEVPLAKLRIVPITVLLDDEGRVTFVHYGTLTPEDLGGLMAHLP